MPTKTAKITNPWTAYGKDEVHTVRVTRSRAACAGPEGVQFTAPGWRPMVFRSMDAAVRKIERHPGFCGWAS